MGFDRPAETLQPANSRDRDTGALCELVLLPADERPRCFDLLRYDEHGWLGLRVNTKRAASLRLSGI